MRRQRLRPLESRPTGQGRRHMKGPDGKWIGYGPGDDTQPPDTGPQVSKIQHRLIYAYPKNSKAIDEGVIENGVYTAQTAAAVKNIQAFINAHTATPTLR